MDSDDDFEDPPWKKRKVLAKRNKNRGKKNKNMKMNTNKKKKRRSTEEDTTTDIEIDITGDDGEIYGGLTGEGVRTEIKLLQIVYQKYGSMTEEHHAELAFSNMDLIH